MLKLKSFLLLAVWFFCQVPVWAQSSSKVNPGKQKIIAALESQKANWETVAQQIWQYAEVGYQEEKSSALLQTKLKENGFAVQAGVAGIPTAFVASFGSGEPVIGILAEFDALPGFSQEAVPAPKPIPGQVAGHACGHHLFGTGSVAAAVAVKQWMLQNKIKGTLKLFGTPAEEGGSGKVYMVREGLFNGVDAVINWHPRDENYASSEKSLANKSAKFRFYGVSSHAAIAPERGRSGLDGVEAMNMMVNLMREHVPAETRIHYVITDGGKAPNVVPDFAEVFYYVRHPDRTVLDGIWSRVVKAAEGAALGTGTRSEHEIIHGNYDLLPNETLSQLLQSNLMAVGGVKYTPEETAFARQLSETLGTAKKPIELAARIQPYQSGLQTGGSTDVGDVSWVTPTAAVGTACWVPGTSAHSWQAVAAGGMSIGMKGMLVAAKTMALTVTDLFIKPELAAKAQAEMIKARGIDFKYQSLLGDRKPALDYRKTK